MNDPCCNPPLAANADSSDAARRLAICGFVALWRGERPQLADIGGDPRSVEALQRQGRIEVDPHGHLVAIHGLTARPTAHRIEHQAGVVHTWCAFDAIGIPAALRIDAQAITTCPTCRQELRITLTGGRPTGGDALRLWLPSSQYAHLVDDFCAHANLYCHHEHLDAAKPRPNGHVVTVTDAAALGRATWRDVADALSRRRTQ
jgi:alkylmercury lyase